MYIPGPPGCLHPVPERTDTLNGSGGYRWWIFFASIFFFKISTALIWKRFEIIYEYAIFAYAIEEKRKFFFDFIIDAVDDIDLVPAH